MPWIYRWDDCKWLGNNYTHLEGFFLQNTPKVS